MEHQRIHSFTERMLWIHTFAELHLSMSSIQKELLVVHTLFAELLERIHNVVGQSCLSVFTFAELL